MHYFSTKFELLCLNKTILKIVLVGFYKTWGNPLENDKDLQNRSLHFAAFKQFREGERDWLDGYRIYKT